MRGRTTPRPVRISVIGIFLAVLVFFMVACQDNGASITTKSDNPSAANYGNSTSDVTKQEVPDITPLAQDPQYAPGAQPAGGVPGIQPPSGGQIGQDDVTTFIKTHIFPGSDGGKQPDIMKTLFLTGADVSALLNGAPTYMPDGEPLIFVEVSGDFTFWGPTINPGYKYKYAFEVFDKTTGNNVMYGGLLQLVSPTQTSPTPTPVSAATATATPAQGATATPKPAATATPVHVVFKVSPQTNTQQCPGPLAGLFITLDNSGSDVDVGWSIAINENITGAPPSTPWATPNLTSGIVPKHNSQALTITPYANICRYITASTTFHATITLTSGGTGTFVISDTIAPQPPIG